MSGKPTNVEMSILKAIGIMAVVISHHLNPTPALFPANSFHMALFLFAAGYFHSYAQDDHPFRYMLKRATWLLTVFYAYHLFHALELHILWQNGFELGGAPPQFPQLLYYPLITFNTYGLGFPMWFIMQLLLAQSVMVLIRWLIQPMKLPEWQITLIFLAGAVVATVGSASGYPDPSPILVVMRTLFCLFFLQLGFLYRTKLEAVIPFNSFTITTVVVVQAIIVAIHPDIAYAVGTMKFYGQPILPFIVACTGIYVCLYLAKALAKHCDERHILCRIGNNSMHISAMHMSFCFIWVLLLREMYGVSDAIKDPLYSFRPYSNWGMYLVIGVLCPVFMIEGLRKLRDRVKQRLHVKIQAANQK
jgi:fucose 4-O-acetylase-like acetyltransferase